MVDEFRSLAGPTAFGEAVPWQAQILPLPLLVSYQARVIREGPASGSACLSETLFGPSMRGEDGKCACERTWQLYFGNSHLAHNGVDPKGIHRAELTRRAMHISVCICSYQRPVLLKRTLSALLRQDSRGRFEYSVVVCDNDSAES